METHSVYVVTIYDGNNTLHVTISFTQSIINYFTKTRKEDYFALSHLFCMTDLDTAEGHAILPSEVSAPF